ncbi:MAG TPA: hypothetical protein DCQ04_08455 [Actinobacteria bacterium]|nr:hypothetical protein [Actinomycetota bacterium]
MSPKETKAPGAGLDEVFSAGAARTHQGARRPAVASRMAKLTGLAVIAGAVVAAGLFPAAAVGIAATGVIHNEWENQPNSVPAPSLPGRTKLLTVDGKKVAEVFSTNRVPVSADQQGPWIRKAVVAVEDARFYSHSGVDPIGTMRALVATGGGDSVQGGSTITQQYAKNLRLTQAAIEAGGEATAETRDALTERSWKRKVAEAHLATVIEKSTSKEDILTGYLNVGYFGSGAYGIQAAARRYYSTDATKLTLSQAATLAGVLQSPVSLDPRLNPERTLVRRAQVLNAMAAQGMVTAAEAAQAQAEPITLALSLPEQGCQVAGRDWGMVCDGALRELKAADWLGPEATNLLRAGGLTVQLSVDPKTQKDVAAAAKDVIPADNRVANAITLVEPGTGYVKGMASNRAFGEGKGATEIPLAMAKKFSPASTFKLFTLVAALEDGIPLSTTLPGGSEYTSDKFDNPNGGYHNAEGLSASDVSISRATEMSINTAYVQLEERVGIPAVADTAKRLGITSIGKPGTSSYPGKKEGTFALGVRDVSVTDMAGAYAAIAAHGRWCPPTLVKSVTLPNGQVITNPVADRCRQAVDPAVADTAASVLQGVIDNGTGRPAALPGRPAAGKTGTGEDNGSAWFAGFTPQVAAAVWTGDPRSPRYTLHGVMGYETVYGSTLPADLWKAGMLSYLEDKPVRQLPGVDPAYLLAPGRPVDNQVIMIDIRGQSVDDADPTLRSRGLVVEVAADPNAGGAWVRSGTVVAQSPAPGARLAPGSTVKLTVRG